MDSITMEAALGPRNNSGCLSMFGSVNVPFVVLVMEVHYATAQLGVNNESWEQRKRWVDMSRASLGFRFSYIYG